jgi:hypothetical protein
VAEKAQHQAKQGTPDQLPRGEARALNEAQAAVPQKEGVDPGAVMPEEEMPEFMDSPEEGDDATTGDKEEDEFLFEDPNPQERDNGRGPGMGPIPKDVLDALPELVEASRDPSAPPQLTMLVQMLSDRLER